MSRSRHAGARLLGGLLAGAVALSGCGGSEDLGGIEFTSAPRDLTAECQDAADQLGFAVPCPTEHPVRGGAVSCEVSPGLANTSRNGCITGTTTFLLAINGIEADSAAESISHFVIEGTRLDDPDRSPNCEGEPARFGPWEGHVGTCDGIHNGHVAVFWDVDETRYVVGAHGDSDVRRRVVRRVAGAIELLPPRTEPSPTPTSSSPTPTSA